MTYQKYLGDGKYCNVICDHEYTNRHCGWKVCVTCGMCLERTMFVIEEGYEDRVIVQREVRRATDDLRVVIRSVFEDLISKLSYSQITVENSLEKLFGTCETYILPDNTLIKEGNRKHPFRVSARPKGLCVALLWKEVLVHKLPITIWLGFREKLVFRGQLL
jgi:hypothetical protein